MIERKKYLDMLIRKKENGMVKVITGIRRCGKSYLLFDIYHKYLNSVGVDESARKSCCVAPVQHPKFN